MSKVGPVKTLYDVGNIVSMMGMYLDHLTYSDVAESADIAQGFAY